MGYCPFSVGFRSTKIVHLLIEVIQTLCIGSATCEIVILDNSGSSRRFGGGGQTFEHHADWIDSNCGCSDLIGG